MRFTKQCFGNTLFLLFWLLLSNTLFAQGNIVIAGKNYVIPQFSSSNLSGNEYYNSNDSLLQRYGFIKPVTIQNMTWRSGFFMIRVIYQKCLK
jgi:hypothetical protein